VAGYADLLKTQGVARIIAAQLTARFPIGMLSIAYLLHIENRTGSYAAAGVVLAAASIGQAIAGPLTSRFMSVWGIRPVIATTLIVCVTAILAIGIIPMTVPFYIVIGFVSGISAPPIQPAVRTIYPKIVNARQLTPLFSLDASAQEIIWVTGPVITTFVSTQVGTIWGILLAVALMIGGGVWFITLPEVGRVRIPRSERRFGVILRHPPVLLATIIGFLLIGACAAVEAGAVALFGHNGAEAGILLAIFSLGSLAAGLATGGLVISPLSLARRMLAVFIGMSLAVLFTDFWWLAITLAIAGLGIAPALAVLFAIVSATVKFRDTAEAYGWVGTGQLTGAALGSAAAGILIDTSGAAGAFWAAAAFALLGTILPAVFARHLPDLRHRDATPQPDTAPVPHQPG
jgi:MFS family permease